MSPADQVSWAAEQAVTTALDDMAAFADQHEIHASAVLAGATAALLKFLRGNARLTVSGDNLVVLLGEAALQIMPSIEAEHLRSLN